MGRGRDSVLLTSTKLVSPATFPTLTHSPAAGTEKHSVMAIIHSFQPNANTLGKHVEVAILPSDDVFVRTFWYRSLDALALLVHSLTKELEALNSVWLVALNPSGAISASSFFSPEHHSQHRLPATLSSPYCPYILHFVRCVLRPSH